MDMVKMGNFLAELRKEHKLTQAELGEKLGVTNKTVSRWENGNYMPPVEALEELSNLYGLTINELLSGRKLKPEEYREMAESNIKDTLQASTFMEKRKANLFQEKMAERTHFNNYYLYSSLGCFNSCVETSRSRDVSLRHHRRYACSSLLCGAE